jgi:hypothetical protein
MEKALSLNNIITHLVFITKISIDKFEFFKKTKISVVCINISLPFF